MKKRRDHFSVLFVGSVLATALLVAGLERTAAVVFVGGLTVLVIAQFARG